MPRFSGTFRMPRAIDPHRHRDIRTDIDRLHAAPLVRTQVIVYSVIAIAVLLVLAATLVRILS